MEKIGGGGSKTRQVKKKKGKHKSTSGIGASLTPDYRVEEEISNICNILFYIIQVAFH